MLAHRRLFLLLALALSTYSVNGFLPSPRFATAKATLATNKIRAFSENDITQGFAELAEEAPFSLQDRVLEVHYSYFLMTYENSCAIANLRILVNSLVSSLF